MKTSLLLETKRITTRFIFNFYVSINKLREPTPSLKVL